MQNAIRIYGPLDSEFDRLIAYACRLASMSTLFVAVRTIYFDAAAGTKWTTLVAQTPSGMSFQALTPRDQAKLLYGSETDKEDTLESVAKNLSKYVA